MKNIKNIISFIIMSLVFVSCEDGGLENVDWLKQPNFTNPLTVTLSGKEVVLAKDKAAANAITFTWTKGNDRGAGTSLTYFFRMDIAGKNFGEGAVPGTSTTITEEIPDGVFTKSYTVGELNALLLKNFKRPGGSVTNLEVQIIARVNNTAQYQLPEVSTSSFAVTSYSPGPLPLFIVGDAATGSWDYSAGKVLPEITERTIYNFVGNFSIGSFKVIEKPGSELPSYDPIAGNKIVYNETNPRTDDNVFKVTKAGRHSFYLDIDNGIYAFGYVPYENVYMVGNAITGIGWDIGKAKPMIWDPKNPEIFTYKGQFDAGEFKLALDLGNWGGRFLMPAANGTVIKGDANDNTTVQLMPNGSPDNKWIIETSGQYELTVNPAKMTIVLKKL
jgi:hypothetical protein